MGEVKKRKKRIKKRKRRKRKKRGRRKEEEEKEEEFLFLASSKAQFKHKVVRQGTSLCDFPPRLRQVSFKL